MDILYFRPPNHLQYIHDTKDEQWYSLIDMQECDPPFDAVLQILEFCEHKEEYHYTLCFNHLGSILTDKLSPNIQSIQDYFEREKMVQWVKRNEEIAYCIERIKLEQLKDIVQDEQFGILIRPHQSMRSWDVYIIDDQKDLRFPD